MTSTITQTSESPTRRRRYLPRFSLAAVLLAVTLCAIGLWYWYRVPFEIVREDKNRREVETVCRTWDGTTRHGPRRVYLDGKLSLEENYRNGVPHGPWQWLDPAGSPYLEAEFHQGKLVSFQSERCEPRLARHLAERTIDDPSLVGELLQPMSVDFIETPLKDALQVIKDMRGIQLELDVKRLEEAGVNIDSPVTCNADNLSLIVAFKEVFAGYPLAADYRYGTIVVTMADSANNWQDSTGVTTITPPPGSALAKAWNKPAKMDFIETPIAAALSIIEDQHGIQFDDSKLIEFEKQVAPHGIPVTKNLSGLSLRDSLGLLFESLNMRLTLQGETLVIEPL